MTKKLATLRLLIPLLLLIVLPLLFVAAQKVQQYLSQAAGTPASIVVDASVTTAVINPIWNSYAQGGEESGDMIGPVVSELTRLSPRYIRIDHVFDHFNVVSRNGSGQLEFNFSSLDPILSSIIKTGATPFIALSYMPQVIAENGDITGKPKDWNEWSFVVQRLVEHVSGRNGLNQANVVYEVWNEPDLFGKWKYYGDKNYLTLYTYAVKGAERAQNTHPYKIGGPATTAQYKNWILALTNHVRAEKLRLDFLSWHRYTDDPTKYAQDAVDITGWLFNKPEAITLPRIVSEWGFESDPHPGYDTSLAAAHTVSSARNIQSGYDLFLAFELVDGPPQAPNQTFWGRWGLISHPQSGKRLKPRFNAFQLLNKLKGSRLLINGEGTWVTGIAAKDENIIRLIVSNFDIEEHHTEEVPITFANIANGEYLLSTTRLGQSSVSTQINVSEGSYTTSIVMPANAVVLFELSYVEAIPFLESNP